jgi:hypothetical protein
MAGGGSDNSSKKMLQYEKQQVAAAEKKEAERQARLKAGVTNINNMFDGAPVMGDRQATYDWTAFNDAAAKASAAMGSNANASNGVGWPGLNSGPIGGPLGALKIGQSETVDPFAGLTLPEGYKVQAVPLASNNSGMLNGAGGKKTETPQQQKMSYQLVGPNGQVYNAGDTLTYNEKYDTGAREGGFKDAFYNNYRDSYLSYYQPQVEDQYTDAKDDTNFGYARAGTLNSSMSAQSLADLYKKKLDQNSMVRSQADAATGQLRNNVADAKNSAINQLYATEDPTLATNLAANSVKGLQGSAPKYDPLGELFNAAAVGAAGYINANSQRASSGGSYGSPGSRSRTSSVG